MRMTYDEINEMMQEIGMPYLSDSSGTDEALGHESRNAGRV